MKMIIRQHLLIIALLSVGITCFAQETLTPLFPCDSILHEPYGITSHITWPGYDYDSYKSRISAIKSLGASFLRTDFNYSGNQGISDNDVLVWDKIVDAAGCKKISVVPLVYPSRYGKYTKEIDELYKRYLSGCLERYGDRIIVWEIWNEMDQMFETDKKVPAPEYLPLLKTSYELIKDSYPESMVLLGAIGSINKPYFGDLLKEGASQYFDVSNVHYYSSRNAPEEIIDYYRGTANLLSEYDVQKPLWLTETGYSTYSEQDNTAPDRFYTEILPQLYTRLGINISNKRMAVILDNRVKRSLRNQDNPAIFTGFKGVDAVGLDDIKSLDINEYPVLMSLFGELFPMVYLGDLESYIRKGGTVVFPEGGAPLYFDMDINTNTIEPVGKTYYKRLHIDCIFTWDEIAKKKGISKRMEQVSLNNSIKSLYGWKEDDMSSPKYFTDANMSKGDELIPVIEGSDGSFTGPIAVCYKLNSDLKGNIIIQSRGNNGHQVSELLQAIRYPRLFLLSFALGAEKVFAYNLAERYSTTGGYGLVHKNGMTKPAYETLKTLIKKLPSGSTRPIIHENNGQYIAMWVNPHGEKIYAVWADKLGLKQNFIVHGAPRYYNSKGKRLNKLDFVLSPDIVYIENSISVSFR